MDENNLKAEVHSENKSFFDAKSWFHDHLQGTLCRKLEKHGFGYNPPKKHRIFIPIENLGPEEVDQAMEEIATSISRNYVSAQVIDVNFADRSPNGRFLVATIFYMTGDLRSLKESEEDEYDSEDDVTKELVRAVKARGVSCGRLEKTEFFVGDDTSEVTAVDEAARLISESEDRVEHIDTEWLKKDDVVKELKVVVFTRK